MSDHDDDHHDDSTPHGGAGMQVDVALVRELAALVEQGELGEIEVRDGHRRIRVSRYGSAPAALAAPAPSAPQLRAQMSALADALEPAAPPPADAPSGGAVDADAVPSPMVGTAYLAAEPGAAPFKSVGDKVSEGDTILIIEAMKVMNAIPAPRGGTLAAVLVDNGQPVEFDQPLFVIR